jgi:uncharacterized iron-regulated protein
MVEFAMQVPQGIFAQLLHAVGIVILVQASLLIRAFGRGARETIVIAAKYHMRRGLGVPADWLPPEDQN